MTLNINELSFASLNEYLTQVNVSTVFLINKKINLSKKISAYFCVVVLNVF